MTKLDRILTAIARNQVATFKKLVTAENVDAVDEDGFTLLVNVILDEDADAEMARHLIDLGADVNRVDADEKWTALAFAARDNRPEIATMLLNAGANPTAQDINGYTPLHRAMHPLSYDHIPKGPILELVATLLDKGADPRQMNRHGESPLSRAKLAGLNEVVAMFEQASNRSAAKPTKKKLAAAKSPQPASRKSATRRAKSTVKRAKPKASTPRKKSNG
jgi:ankyrin repeat protein